MCSRFILVKGGAADLPAPGDPFAIEWEDPEQDPNEERYGVIGMVEGRLLFVGYTMRGEKIRIITARKAEPYERRRYHEENREA